MGVQWLRKGITTVLAASAVATSSLTMASPAALGVKPLDKPLNIKFCIFDIAGTQGDVYNYAKDLVLEGRKWNVFAELQVYTDERVAAESFKAGQCDGVAVSTLRAKQFNHFVGSLDAVGAVPTYPMMRKVLQVLMGNPKLNALTISGPYQVAGVIPVGSAYVMVRDRSIDTIEKAAGKKVAVLDWDKSQAQMVQQLGAQPVASDVTNFAGKFNNGQVDIIAAPAIAFKPLELYRGLGKTGAIYRLPLVSITGSVVINHAKLSKQVPDIDSRIAKVREYALSQLDHAFKIIEASEKEIEPKYWMDLSPRDTAKYTQMMREARIQLTKEGVYDPRMMSLLKKVRCQEAPGNAECALNDE